MITSSASRVILIALVGTACLGFLSVLFDRSIPLDYGKDVVTLFSTTLATVVGYYVGKQAQPPANGDPMGGN